MNKVGVIGWPVTHSISPAMHNAAFEALGLHDWQYELLPIPPDIVRQGLRTLRDEGGFVGVNVTVPHKQAVMPYVKPDERARAVGAVNSIDFRHNLGTNTDVAGFIDDLTANGVELTGARVIVLGAGGAARAAVYGLVREGARVIVVNRTPEKARVMLSEMGLTLTPLPPLPQGEGEHPHPPPPSPLHGEGEKIPPPSALSIHGEGEKTPPPVPLPVHREGEKRGTAEVKTLDEAAQMDVSLIVNCTAVGMWPKVDESPWIEGVLFPQGVTVYDMVYRPAVTTLMRQAEAAGGRAIGGLGMLVRQGAAAFTLWTGQDAPVEVMFAAAQKALKNK